MEEGKVLELAMLQLQTFCGTTYSRYGGIGRVLGLVKINITLKLDPVFPFDYKFEYFIGSDDIVDNCDSIAYAWCNFDILFIMHNHESEKGDNEGQTLSLVLMQA